MQFEQSEGRSGHVVSEGHGAGVVSRDVLPNAVVSCGGELARGLENGATPESLRSAISAFARIVRLHAIPPERALAAFKFMVRGLPTIYTQGSEEIGQLSSRLMQIAIEEYYASA